MSRNLLLLPESISQESLGSIKIGQSASVNLRNHVEASNSVKAISTVPQVLVVDDCSFNVIAVQDQLEQLGFSSEFASNGHEAAKAVKKRLQKNTPMYKLILMDYSMPGIDGPSATQIIRKDLSMSGNYTDRDPYICLITAYGEEKFHQKALDAGMNTTMVKPIFKNQIQKLLHSAGLLD